MSERLVPFGLGEAEFIEKKSRFIGRVWHIEDEREGLSLLEGVRKRHWDASHNVYAYSVTGGAARFSDDGEPSGTAGRPVFEVFSQTGVGDYLCVVTRYFGGTLLGAGGLVRAYAHTAALALGAAGTARLQAQLTFTLETEYSLLERIKMELEAAGGALENAAYGERVTLEFRLPEQAETGFTARLRELSAGCLRPIRTGGLLVPERV